MSAFGKDKISKDISQNKYITREEIIGRKNKFSNTDKKNIKLLKNITDGQAVTLVYVDATRGWAYKTNTA